MQPVLLFLNLFFLISIQRHMTINNLIISSQKRHQILYIILLLFNKIYI